MVDRYAELYRDFRWSVPARYNIAQACCGQWEAGVHAWEPLLERASRNFKAVDTRADDPAVIIYTSGTTGAPKGALQAHRLIVGNIPGFVHSHDFFPQAGDLFWSPADWAWPGGVSVAWRRACHFAIPIPASPGASKPGRLGGAARLDRTAVSGASGRGDRRPGQGAAARRAGRDRRAPEG